jgi:hypothetical protein
MRDITKRLENKPGASSLNGALNPPVTGFSIHGFATYLSLKAIDL